LYGIPKMRKPAGTAYVITDTGNPLAEKSKLIAV